MNPPPAERPAAEISAASPPPAPRQGLLAWIYLGLALAGALLPWLANLEFLRTYGSPFNLELFVRLANDNPAAASLSRDLLIGASAVTIWIVSESRRLKMRGLAWVLLSSVTIAFAFAAPFFLYLRERRLRELEASADSPINGTETPPAG